MRETEIKEINETANEIRKLTIEMIGRVGVGHIGGCLSIIEILAVLLKGVMPLKCVRSSTALMYWRWEGGLLLPGRPLIWRTGG